MTILAAACAAAFAVPAHAQGDGAYRSCMERSDQTNPAWAACGAALVARESARLERAWRRASLASHGTARIALARDQRRWLSRRDRSCLELLSGYGREGEVVDFPLCRAEVIRARTMRLQRLGGARRR